MTSIKRKYTVEIVMKCDDMNDHVLEEYFKENLQQELLRGLKDLRYFRVYFPSDLLNPYASDPYKENKVEYQFWAEEVK